MRSQVYKSDKNTVCKKHKDIITLKSKQLTGQPQINEKSKGLIRNISDLIEWQRGVDQGKLFHKP